MKATEFKNIKTLSIEESSFINIMVKGYITKDKWGDLILFDFEPKWENKWEPFFPEYPCMLISSKYFQFIKTNECWYFERNCGISNVTDALKEVEQ